MTDVFVVFSISFKFSSPLFTKYSLSFIHIITPWSRNFCLTLCLLRLDSSYVAISFQAPASEAPLERSATPLLRLFLPGEWLTARCSERHRLLTIAISAGSESHRSSPEQQTTHGSISVYLANNLRQNIYQNKAPNIRRTAWETVHCHRQELLTPLLLRVTAFLYLKLFKSISTPHFYTGVQEFVETIC